MSDLGGNLASFGLRPVLRLLAETAKTGELRVSAGGFEGRILFQGGSIAYATTATGAGTVEELDALLARYEAGGFDQWAFGGDAGHTPAALETVLEEQLTEVLYHLTPLEEGSFTFIQAPDPQVELDAFTVDHVLGLVDTRIEAWRRIRQVIPSNESPYRPVARLPRGTTEVTIPASQWALLSALGGGSSVTELAATLEVYPFHAARKLVELLEAGLLEANTGSSWPPQDGWTAGDRQGFEDAAGWDLVADNEEAGRVPRLEPTTEPVVFSKADLTREEMDEIIRNIGKGIFPS